MIGVLHFALSGDAVSVFLDKPTRVTELHAFYAKICVVCPIIWYYKRAGWSFVLVISSRYSQTYSCICHTICNACELRLSAQGTGWEPLPLPPLPNLLHRDTLPHTLRPRVRQIQRNGGRPLRIHWPHLATATLGMDSDRIRMKSDPNVTFYHILIRIRMRMRISSDTNTKQMVRIRIRI